MEDKIANAAQHTFDSDITSVHGARAYPEIVAVFADGTVRLCADTADLTEVACVKPKRAPRRVVFTHLEETPAGNARTYAMVVLLRQELQPGHFGLELLQVRKGSGSAGTELVPVATHTIEAPVAGAVPLSAAFQLSTRSVSVVWSSGDWFLLQFPGGSSSLAFRTKPRMAQRTKLVFPSDTQTPVIASAFVAPSTILVAGQLGRDAKAPVLTLWETQFGTLQAQAPLALGNAPLDITEAKRSNPSAGAGAGAGSRKQAAAASGRPSLGLTASAGEQGGPVLVLLHNKVLALTVRCEPPTLAAVAGRMQLSAAFIQTGQGQGQAQAPAAQEAALVALPNPLPAVFLSPVEEKKSGKEGKSGKDGKHSKVGEPRDALVAAWQASVRQAETEEEAVLTRLLTLTPKRLAATEFSRVFDEYMEGLQQAQTHAHALANSAAGGSAAASGSVPASTDDKPGKKRKRADAGDVAETKARPAGLLPVQLSQQFVSRVARHCVSASDLWGPLRVLVRSNQLSGRACPNLVRILLEQGQLDLVEECLLHVHDIAESDLAVIVRFCLDTLLPSASNTVSGSASGSAASRPKSKPTRSKAKHASASSPLSVALPDPSALPATAAATAVTSEMENRAPKRRKKGPRDDAAERVTVVPVEMDDGVIKPWDGATETPAETLLHLAVSAPKSDGFLQDALRSLALPYVLGMMRYLLKWLQCYAQFNERTLRQLRPGKRTPTFGQVLDWLMILLDAHFAELVLLPRDSSSAATSMREECLQLLHALQGVSALHVTLGSRSESLRGFLVHLLAHFLKGGAGARSGLPHAASVATADYCVQVISL